MKRTAFAALALACASMGLATAAISTFDDLTLGTNSYWNGSGGEGSFNSGGATFKNYYSTEFGVYWDGFSYSNMSDTVTPGFGNQYSANTGAGVGGTGNYAIFTQPFVAGPSITFAGPSLVESMMVTNTTYATQSMLLGDGFAKAFGGVSGNDADWFKLTITGQGGTGSSVEFYLADYRFSDNSQDFILDDWTSVDLTSLGEVTGLTFTLSSSDSGQFGMNTPAYFALDNLQFVPEPSAALLALIGLVPLLRRRRAV